MNNLLRNGNFTSSEIVALVSMNKGHTAPGAPYHTYINECNMERRLGRSITKEVNSKPTSWGSLVEGRVNELLSTDYRYCSKETLPHSTVSCWAGSPDFIHYHDESHLDSVCDVKCPATLDSFCKLVDAWEKSGINGIRENHKDGEKFYWQLVSNSCITMLKYAELIVYCPYKSELDEIRKMADGNPKYYWIQFAQDEELPYLIEGRHYKNLNVFRFIVPPNDKIFLHSRVEMAAKELIQSKTLIPA